jgi:hypothetical protein
MRLATFSVLVISWLLLTGGLKSHGIEGASRLLDASASCNSHAHGVSTVERQDQDRPFSNGGQPRLFQGLIPPFTLEEAFMSFKDELSVRTEPISHSAGSAEARFHRIPTDLIDPSGDNPNELTEQERIAYYLEVCGGGSLPKPIVVRRVEGRYKVIDGEQTLALAKCLHQPLVTCEIIEADDFEALRQSFTRNQHGHPNPVKQGRRFKRMMELRGWSSRKLANELNIKEKDVNAAVRFADAAAVRDKYAPGRGQDEIAKLKPSKVKSYLKQDEAERDRWLDNGGHSTKPSRKVQAASSQPAALPQVSGDTGAPLGASANGGDAPYTFETFETDLVNLIGALKQCSAKLAGVNFRLDQSRQQRLAVLNKDFVVAANHLSMRMTTPMAA